MTITYRLIFRGEVAQGESIDAVKQRVAQLFKLPPEPAGRLFSGTEVVLKKGTDEASLKTLQATMTGLGALTNLQGDLDLDLDGPAGSQSAPAQVPPPPAPVSSAPAPTVQAQRQASTADYGLVLLAIPVIAALVIWFWVGSMNLLQSPESSLTLIMVVAVVGTAILAAMEAARAGMVSDRRHGTYGPTQWFFIVALFWIVGYPAYLLKRKHYALKNLLIPGIAVAVLLIGTSVAMTWAVEQKKSGLIASLDGLSAATAQRRSNHVTAAPSANPASLDDRTVRAQVAQGLSAVESVQVAVAEYFAANGAWPADDAGLNYKAPPNQYVSAVTTANGIITIKYGNQADPRIAGTTLALVPALNANTDSSWICGEGPTAEGFAPAGRGSTSVPRRYLPQQCGGRNAGPSAESPRRVDVTPVSRNGLPSVTDLKASIGLTREQVIQCFGRPNPGTTDLMFVYSTISPYTNQEPMCILQFGDPQFGESDHVQDVSC